MTGSDLTNIMEEEGLTRKGRPVRIFPTRLGLLALCVLVLQVPPLRAGNPRRAEHFLRKGIEAMRAGELAKAEDLFLRAQRAEPILPQPETMLGHLAMASNQFDAAEASFERAIDLHRDLKTNLQQQAARNLAAARDNLALLDNELQRSENERNATAEARRVQLEAAKIREEQKLDKAEFSEEEARIPAELFLFLGNARVRAGRPETAIDTYREAIRRLPDAPEPHHNLAVALLQSDRLEEALEECLEAEGMGYQLSVALHRRIESLRTGGADALKVD